MSRNDVTRLPYAVPEQKPGSEIESRKNDKWVEVLARWSIRVMALVIYTTLVIAALLAAGLVIMSLWHVLVDIANG